MRLCIGWFLEGIKNVKASKSYNLFALFQFKLLLQKIMSDRSIKSTLICAIKNQIESTTYELH